MGIAAQNAVRLNLKWPASRSISGGCNATRSYTEQHIALQLKQLKRVSGTSQSAGSGRPDTCSMGAGTGFGVLRRGAETGAISSWAAMTASVKSLFLLILAIATLINDQSTACRQFPTEASRQSRRPPSALLTRRARGCARSWGWPGREFSPLTPRSACRCS